MNGGWLVAKTATTWQHVAVHETQEHLNLVVPEICIQIKYSVSESPENVLDSFFEDNRIGLTSEHLKVE
jgi:hypothetical protein